MRKYKNIAILPAMLIITFALGYFSYIDIKDTDTEETGLPNYDGSTDIAVAAVTEIPQTSQITQPTQPAQTENIYGYMSDDGDLSAWNIIPEVKKRFFTDSNFDIDNISNKNTTPYKPLENFEKLKNTEYFKASPKNRDAMTSAQYSVIKTLTSGNKIVNVSVKINDSEILNYYILTDKNGKCLTEIFYGSLEEFESGGKYLKGELQQLNVADIIDSDTGEIVKDFYNCGIYLSRPSVSSNGQAQEPMYSFSVGHTYYYDAENDRIYSPEEADEYSGGGNLEQKSYVKCGYLNKDFNILIPPVYDSIMPCDDTYEHFVYFIDSKYFIGDIDGNQISEYQYDALCWYYDSYEGNVYRAFRDGKYCILGPDYKEIVPPTYDLIGVFTNGYAPVVVGDEAYYIDGKGNRVDVETVKKAYFETNPGDSESDFDASLPYIFESDINKKIEKYFSNMEIWNAPNLNLLDLTSLLSPPCPIDSILYEYPTVTNEMIKGEMKYTLGVDDSYFPDEKMQEIRKDNEMRYDPETDSYTFERPDGFYPRYVLDGALLNVHDKGRDIYEAQILPVVIDYTDAMGRGSENFDFGLPTAFVLGNSGEKYYIDSFLSPEIIARYEEEDSASSVTYNYFYNLKKDDPELNTLKQAYEQSLDKYETLTLTFKITAGGLINLMQ
ncbi:MAG: WG repeat-containing protein [Oscillospiraceae bacterium]|nr:WG repeat-containing protein [Oscillospiraceae bacterium]